MLKASIAPSVSEAIVRLHADGSVTVLASTVELGQGARTVMAQIAAEVLAVPLARVTVLLPDTSVTPYDQTTSSSRSTTMVGKAVQEAAGDVVEQLVRIAARALDAAVTTLRVDDGAVVHGDRRLDYGALLRRHFGMAGGELIGKGISDYSARELARVKGMKSDAVRELLPHAADEVIHRDRFVLL